MVIVLFVPPPKRKRFCDGIQKPDEPIHMIDLFDVPTIAEIRAKKRPSNEIEKNLSNNWAEDKVVVKKIEADVKEEWENHPIAKPSAATSLKVNEPSVVLPVAVLESEPLKAKPLFPKRVIESTEVTRKEEVKSTISEKGMFEAPKKAIASKRDKPEKGMFEAPKEAIASKRDKPDLRIVETKEKLKTDENTSFIDSNKDSVIEEHIKAIAPKGNTPSLPSEKTKEKQRKEENTSLGDSIEEDFMARAAHELRYWKAKLKQEEEQKAESQRRVRATRLRWWDAIIGIRNHEVCWLRKDETLEWNLKPRQFKVRRRNNPLTVSTSKPSLDNGYKREEYMSSDLLKSMSKIRQKLESSSKKSGSPRKSENKASKVSQRRELKTPGKSENKASKVSQKRELKTPRKSENKASKVSQRRELKTPRKSENKASKVSQRRELKTHRKSENKASKVSQRRELKTPFKYTHQKRKFEKVRRQDKK